MSKKMIWGLAILIVLLISASVFLLMRTTDTEPKVIYNDVAPTMTPPPAEPGFKWVWHGDHWDKVSVAPNPPEVTPVVQAVDPTPINPPVQMDPPIKPAYTGPLTFHEELLESNPLEALRLQSEERGHWSAKWIAEFDADDEEAQAFARTVYLNMYYDTLRKNTGKIPISEEEYNRLGEEYDAHLEYTHTIPNKYRGLALMRIAWAYLPPEREPIINN